MTGGDESVISDMATYRLDFPMGEPNEESLRAIQEADGFFDSGKPARFKTASEMIASLEA